MAGSYAHVVTNKKGKLLNPTNLHEMLDSRGDVYEAIEEMYGMIWLLGTDIAIHDGIPPEQAVEQARQNYAHGLSLSPGIQAPDKRLE